MRKLFTTLGAVMISLISFAQIANLTITGTVKVGDNDVASQVITQTGGSMSLKLSVSTGTIVAAMWQISDPALASITDIKTDDGTEAKLNAKSDGMVTVTVTAMDALATITSTFDVTISNQILSLSLTGASTLTATGTSDEITLDVTGNLSTISPTNLSWMVTPSSGASVADGSLKLRGKNNGVVTVTAMSKADPTIMSNSIEVEVIGFVAIASATVVGTNVITTSKGFVNLTPSFLPTNATNPKFSWSSSDDCGLKVDDGPTGKMVAFRNGVYTITGKYSNGGSEAESKFIITVTNQMEGFFETFNLPYDGNPFSGLSGNQVGGGGYWNGSVAAPWANAAYVMNPSPTQGDLSIVVTSTTGTRGTILLDGSPFDGDAFAYIATGFDKSAGFPWNWGCGVKTLPANRNIKMEVANKSAQPITLYLGVGGKNNGNDVFGTNRIDTDSIILPANSSTMVVQTVTTATVKYLKVGLGNLLTNTANVVFNYISIGQDEVTGITLSPSKASLAAYKDNLVVTASVLPANAPQEVTWTMAQSKPGIAVLSPTGLLTGLLTATGIANGSVTITGKSLTNQVMGTLIVNITGSPSILTIAAPGDITSFTGGDLGFTATSNVTAADDDLNITWSVAGSSAATIANDGILTSSAVSSNVVITVTAVSGTFTELKDTYLLTLIPVPIVVLAPAKVQVIHNSPGAPAVDVWVNGTTVLSGVVYRTASGFLNVPVAMPATVQIAVTGSNPYSIISTDVLTLTSAMSYRAIATGVVGTTVVGQEFDVTYSAATTSTTAGFTGLDIYHSAPDAPTVGVVARGVATLVSAFSFKDDAFVSVPSNLYTVDVNAGSATGATVASFTAPLAGFAGQNIAVLASGLLGANSFGLIAVAKDGTVIVLPAFVLSTSNPSNVSVSVFPNPASSSVNVSASEEVVSLTLFDVAGVAVSSAKATSLSVEGVASGLYILAIETKSGITRKTVIKE